MAEPDRGDIVNDFRAARARLRLGPYERYLAERLAVRVARLSDKRDAEERGGDDQGDVYESGGRAASPDSLSRVPTRTTRPFEATASQC